MWWYCSSSTASKFPRQVRAALEEPREDMAPKDLKQGFEMKRGPQARRLIKPSSAPSTNEVVARAARGPFQQARSLPNRPGFQTVQFDGQEDDSIRAKGVEDVFAMQETGLHGFDSHAAPGRCVEPQRRGPTFAARGESTRRTCAPPCQTRVETPCCKGNLVGTMRDPAHPILRHASSNSVPRHQVRDEGHVVLTDRVLHRAASRCSGGAHVGPA